MVSCWVADSIWRRPSRTGRTGGRRGGKFPRRPSKVAEWFEAGHMCSRYRRGSGIISEPTAARDAERIVSSGERVVQVMAAVHDPSAIPGLAPDGEVKGFVALVPRARRPAREDLARRKPLEGDDSGGRQARSLSSVLSSRRHSAAAPSGLSPGIRRSAATSTTASTWPPMPIRLSWLQTAAPSSTPVGVTAGWATT